MLGNERSCLEGSSVVDLFAAWESISQAPFLEEAGNGPSGDSSKRGSSCGSYRLLQKTFASLFSESRPSASSAAIPWIGLPSSGVSSPDASSRNRIRVTIVPTYNTDFKSTVHLIFLAPLNTPVLRLTISRVASPWLPPRISNSPLQLIGFFPFLAYFSPYAPSQSGKFSRAECLSLLEPHLSVL
ncbi:hypothetical protein BDN70DRAFT_902352, partial [Pholiota conissans]